MRSCRRFVRAGSAILAVMLMVIASGCTAPPPITPQSVSLPASFTVTAPDWIEATVTWHIAKFPESVDVDCNPESGDTLAIGVHQVQCEWLETGWDFVQGEYTFTPHYGSFTVTVLANPDPFPIMELPAPIELTAPDLSGAVVTFTTSALVGPASPVPVTCDHSSGDLFPVGDTTVTCSATSPTGKVTSDSFLVTVRAPIKEISTEGLSCAVRVDDSVRCAVRITQGSSTKIEMVDAGFSGPVLSLSAVAPSNINQYFQHACAVIVGGTVECLGGNSSGQLGDGTRVTSNSPVSVVGITNAVQVSVAPQSSCARLADATVKCWGDNDEGQLGDGSTGSFSEVPVTVSGLTDAVDIALGGGTPFNIANLTEDQHACAVRATGGVVCWGANANSQLGDGTNTNSSTPRPVLGVSGAVDVSAGGLTSCALDSTGLVTCWGDNEEGQLGDGTTDDYQGPNPVVGLTDAAEIHTGWGHSCALRTAGDVMCWGRGDIGQMGDGLSTDRPTAAVVPSLSGVVSLSSGRNGSCAVLSDQTARCWGLQFDSAISQYVTSNVPIVPNY